MTPRPSEGPAEPRLRTRWAGDVSPDHIHSEYPRPQLVRPEWRSLNGPWEYAIRPAHARPPREYHGEILVPFPVESQLGGVGRRVGPEQRLWYRTHFRAPPLDRQRLLLHFGAVDWHAEVRVNGAVVGEHRGGYDPFSVDVSGALTGEGDQELIVVVWDPTDSGEQPRGKQVLHPHTIWYTPVTGIWQTVWLEPVPEVSIERLHLVPDVDAGALRVRAELRGDGVSGALRVVARAEGVEVTRATGSSDGEIELAIPDPRLWSPDDPFLYDLEVELYTDGEPRDRVGSYFGMRKIERRRDAEGHLRLFLNGAPLFQLGLLDQGYWPDGLYTAPSDEALRYDLEVTRQLGFNLVRKHVKVEPDRWYWHCDRLGLLVWQDMPSGLSGASLYEPGRAPGERERTSESAAAFRRELQAIIVALRNHPSIVAWVPFNEAWGQFETNDVLAWTRDFDPTRLVDGPSGWVDLGSGHLRDLHQYGELELPEPEEHRPTVLGEFGGLSLALPGHVWADKGWGYRGFETAEALDEAYAELLDRIADLARRGLAAAVYTQTTDVETEINGLLTYDRAAIKLDPERLRALHRAVIEAGSAGGVDER